VKNFYKQVKWLALDTEKFLNPAKVLSEEEINAFIATGLNFLHKKFNLDHQSLEAFLQENQSKQT
jgi:hypothetical protein